jgi:PIN domain nuclease of toxin-antitoxin system
MTEVVLDASALIAFLRKEPGASKVESVLSRACISAVNLTETITKMIDYGKPLEQVAHQISRLQIPVIHFDPELAHITASLRASTRQAGLSLGDRACLALALKKNLPAFTTDDEWKKCKHGVQVVKIR